MAVEQQDTLELIKQKVLSILEGVDGFLNVYRNRIQLVSEEPETKTPLLPGCVLLDGRERPTEEDAGFQGRSRRGQMPQVTMYWEPQIFIVLMPRETVANEGVGEELSAFRMKVHKALTTNRDLYMLLGENGSITYLGYDSDLEQGNDCRGQMRLDYRFAYLF